MSYRDFSYREALRAFSLDERRANLFGEVAPVAPSEWLSETLRRTLGFALPVATEKAKSEFIVAPILVELGNRNKDNLAIYSGIRLDVAPAQGLNGECDFIISQGIMSYALKPPILAMVEAKRSEIELGMGQCVAQMVGAQLFNETDGQTSNVMFGCVTTGETWQFLKLEGATLIIDNQRYYLDAVARLLGVLQNIVEFAG